MASTDEVNNPNSDTQQSPESDQRNNAQDGGTPQLQESDKTEQQMPGSDNVTTNQSSDNTNSDVNKTGETTAKDGSGTGDITHAEEQGGTEEQEVEPEPFMPVDPAVIEKLSIGVLGLYLPNLQKAKSSLNEVLHNQEVLIETMQQENSKFNDTSNIIDLVEMMAEARRYHNKLVSLKREMVALTDKSAKLKKRSLKLQQQKQKEEMQRAQQREREMEKERRLTAKVVKKPSVSNENT